MSYAEWVPSCPQVDPYTCSISAQGDYFCPRKQQMAEHFYADETPSTSKKDHNVQNIIHIDRGALESSNKLKLPMNHNKQH